MENKPTRKGHVMNNKMLLRAKQFSNSPEYS